MDAGNERDITQSHSQETLRRVKENDESLTDLWIGGTVHIHNHQGNEVVEVCAQGDLAFMLKDYEGAFNPSDDKEFTSLNKYIATNTHLTKLVHVDGRVGLDVECLRRNSSIHKLRFIGGGRDISNGVIYDILQVYQEKGNLIRLDIIDANLQNGGETFLVNTLRSFTNLKTIVLFRCGITDARLQPIMEAIRSHRMLEKLNLSQNSFGNIGCEAIATLLEDLHCNIHTLSLAGNNINDDGTITIANSLVNNTSLQNLYLKNIHIDQSVEESFCRVLCNTSSISDVYSSNHTLNKLKLFRQSEIGERLRSLIKLNMILNKSHVAIRKILKYHPNIDMRPMFEWDAEEGEQNLKALPYIISWFVRAGRAVADEEEGSSSCKSDSDDDGEDECYNIEQRKLSAILQFAKAMPLLFGGVATINMDGSGKSCNKRKRTKG